jgi:nicotinate-nucleotide adenylyltransferase
MKRLGILGGTFDPVHIGHLVMASYAIDALSLDEVWFMPAQTPPHKHREITDIQHRAEMCRLAVDLDSRFEFSNLDLQGGAPSYTSELLQRIHDLMPDAHLVFLVGTDSLSNFPSWHEPERILSLASLGVAERPGSFVQDSVFDALLGLRERVQLFDSPLIELSSTEIRDRRRSGKSITYLVPERVENYILEKGLYRRRRENAASASS